MSHLAASPLLPLLLLLGQFGFVLWAQEQAPLAPALALALALALAPALALVLPFAKMVLGTSRVTCCAEPRMLLAVVPILAPMKLALQQAQSCKVL